MAEEEIKPITPAGVMNKTVPEGVMEAWNEIITENFDNNSGVSHFTQGDIVVRILQKMKAQGATRQEVFDKGWLNMEAKFEMAGWDVDYDKPGFSETYEANFTFTPKERK